MSQFIVIDSNIWLGEQMLRHSIGSALRFYIKRHGARLALPEVVRLEVIHNLAIDFIKNERQMRNSHDRMVRMIGSLKELVLPSHDDLRSAAKSAFYNLGLDIVDIPFSINSARASFEKCITGSPPSGEKNQQFKDGVVWADCLKLADMGPVKLITKDRGFYKDLTYEKGLADNLEEESKKTKHGVSVTHELSLVLDEFKTAISIDYAELGRLFIPTTIANFDGMVRGLGFELGSLDSGSHTLFATDDPNEFHIEFDLVYVFAHPDGRTGQMISRGKGILSTESNEILELQNNGAQLVHLDEQGKQAHRRIILTGASDFLGHRDVHNDVRVKLQS